MVRAPHVCLPANRAPVPLRDHADVKAPCHLMVVKLCALDPGAVLAGVEVSVWVRACASGCRFAGCVLVPVGAGLLGACLCQQVQVWVRACAGGCKFGCVLVPAGAGASLGAQACACRFRWYWRGVKGRCRGAAPALGVDGGVCRGW